MSGNKPKQKPRAGALRRNSVAAIQAFLKGPPLLTPEEAATLDQIIQAERERGLTDFRNPLATKETK
jgi:hypothetical protein